ncbi:leucine-rich repeat extensin-like protein 1 [Nicotiana sylvestris]|uniref:leucine-rich repeat extensin-like protein 1 n=1 Tax=Nicotiana sylvestris TaxID=4096 RepID=UPI00388C9B13
MAEMYQAWVKGHPPPSYPANPSFVPPLTQSQEPPTTNLSPGFPIYHHYQGTTSQTPQALPTKPVPYPPPPATPVFVAPPPATLHRSSSEPLFQTQDNQYYPPETTFKAPKPYFYIPRFDLPIETEKPPKKPEQEEMFRKLPVGFKMPKFDLYDGHRDPMAHLRGLCSKMR